MVFSSAGKKKLAAQAFLFSINVIVLALAARVNQFQDFFYVADLFPLGLSIATLVLLVFLLSADLGYDNAYTGRAHVEVGIFGVLSLCWLSFSAFSTSRWQHIPFKCDSIPADSPDERTWCKDVQVLKGFVWIEFLTCLIITLSTFRYASNQHSRGHKHIWKMPLSRYRPGLSDSTDAGMGRNSEFLQYGRFD
ncbi:hypothetical protein P691DRAFT_671132 [Macrolepiota fuliginosa MF-IS2]|uniref:MARVEL domain-containing protein n=1 Tax=Macrolepiota fuliginosa MF-IS2 TaxID=1400762 RepID=A0A9P5XA31_9AGAR|nr:hypothetical protein P691DRAFT_671132 [Macrolepiota fuliginosa MF-IS2]